MRTEMPSIFLYWQHADQPLIVDALAWAMTDQHLILQSGLGLDSLIQQINTLNNPALSLSNNSSHGNLAITLIVPAETVLINSVSVPSSKLQHIRAAVPHLVEDWSAAEIETLHIATASRADNGKVPIAAISKELLTHWLAALETAGLRCEQIYIDALLLPSSFDTLALFVDKNRILLRWAAHNAGAINIDSLEPLLRSLLKHGDIRKIQWSAEAATDVTVLERVQTLLADLQHRHEITVDRDHAVTTFWQLLSKKTIGGGLPLINLRQGVFAVPDRHQASWRRWRPTVLVASFFAVAIFMLNAIGGIVLNHRASIAHAQNEALYRELFPQDQRLVNVAQQFRAHLATASNDGHAPFLLLFSQLAETIKNNNTEPPLQLRSLVFDAATGVLQVELVTPNIQTLDTLQKQLSAQHLRSKVISAIKENGSLIGRLSIVSGA
ncbi:MAG: type secretion system protein GspL [Verrucomicrobiaceae bacterium]|nr:type secretion system protein GspL [Verrucomicrobiaceae bacterium]